ncbi:hypothetical protein BBJ29_004457 [Phytophthora kernoviae]|uniref:TRP C-terminal domain-containing protein n=1 Tax=Phytophthora kernoviae TaxID=325452 RepID=A0A3F2S1M9_9STRA|nr:hypothetical protein BBJ29_004457 [Phytophthora kernoviae]RLN68459.1 hypothetical protein BBP00_00001053 [Phytophthora kernoviae]
MMVMGRWSQLKNKIKAFFKRDRRINTKTLFGVDVTPPIRTFPVNPSKFKIFLGFFQIFGNFQSSFTVKWSTSVQNVMSVSQKFNLDFVAIAGIDCVITKNFYFDFTATVGLIVLIISVITAYFYAGLFRSVHTECPIKKHVLSGAMLDRTIRSNLRVWQARVKLRMNYLTYRNKCLKLYCWVALFLYPTVSKTILTVYNCQEVGDVYYLVADRRLVCYDREWALFGVVATVGVVVWVVGIPFFFGLLIWLAQDRGVAARLRLLRKPQLRVQRKKWLKEVEEQQVADGRYVRGMDSIEVQDEELAKYMKRKNLADSTVQARLGFIYAEYADGFWWFEVVDLSRKLFLSGVIIFVGNGSVEQVLLALGVCLVTMWFLLYFQPYDGHSDNLIASIAQLQLFFTLWLGIMIRLNDLNTESMINTQLLGYLLVGTCIAVTGFGLSMIVGEGLAESRRLFIEAKAEQKEKVQVEVWKRWTKAYNYAIYEAQMMRFGGKLSFSGLNESAMLEASRRAKLKDRGTEVDSAMPRIKEDEGENSCAEIFHEADNKNVVAIAKVIMLTAPAQGLNKCTA